MLYTIYKLTYPGHEVVDQYYKWKLNIPETDLVKEDRPGPPRKMRSTIDCPGCGKVLNYHTIYTDGHKCPGTLTDHPVRPGKPRMALNKHQKERLFQDYVARQSHPITYSNE